MRCCCVDRVDRTSIATPGSSKVAAVDDGPESSPQGDPWVGAPRNLTELALRCVTASEALCTSTAAATTDPENASPWLEHRRTHYGPRAYTRSDRAGASPPGALRRSARGGPPPNGAQRRRRACATAGAAATTGEHTPTRTAKAARGSRGCPAGRMAALGRRAASATTRTQIAPKQVSGASTTCSRQTCWPGPAAGRTSGGPRTKRRQASDCP